MYHKYHLIITKLIIYREFYRQCFFNSKIRGKNSLLIYCHLSECIIRDISGHAFSINVAWRCEQKHCSTNLFKPSVLPIPFSETKHSVRNRKMNSVHVFQFKLLPNETQLQIFEYLSSHEIAPGLCFDRSSSLLRNYAHFLEISASWE